MKKINAFTMAEAILVMTILGIIATIMISTLRPSDYKNKGMEIQAIKQLEEIDIATKNILADYSMDGTMNYLYAVDKTLFDKTDAQASSKLGKLYQKYLVVKRDSANSDNIFYLKNGSSFGVIFTSGQPTSPIIFPGETEIQEAKTPYGTIIFDINGRKEPDIYGKDQFQVPISSYGIEYNPPSAP